jgi:hypothetical protein
MKTSLLNYLIAEVEQTPANLSGVSFFTRKIHEEYFDSVRPEFSKYARLGVELYAVNLNRILVRDIITQSPDYCTYTFRDIHLVFNFLINPFEPSWRIIATLFDTPYIQDFLPDFYRVIQNAAAEYGHDLTDQLDYSDLKLSRNSLENRKVLPPITDPTDQRIIDIVRKDPSISDQEIGGQVKLSRQAVNKRRNGLEKMGYKVRD